MERILSSPASLAIKSLSNYNLTREIINLLRTESTENCKPPDLIADCSNKICLFNILDDPCETKDLSYESSLQGVSIINITIKL